jgi:hypothetical protein
MLLSLITTVVVRQKALEAVKQRQMVALTTIQSEYVNNNKVKRFIITCTKKEKKGIQ